jgi:hypothetical protein
MVAGGNKETFSFAQKVVVLGESTASWCWGYDVQRSQGVLLSCRLPGAGGGPGVEGILC